MARETRPSERTNDTGECRNDVDKCEGGRCHGKFCLGEEYSGARDCGNAIREEEPGCEEEDNILKATGADYRLEEGVPSVADISWPRAAFVRAGKWGARPRSEVECRRYREDKPPEADEKEDE